MKHKDEGGFLYITYFLGEKCFWLIYFFCKYFFCITYIICLNLKNTIQLFYDFSCIIVLVKYLPHFFKKHFMKIFSLQVK